jgi:hypothetical protein
MRLEADGTRCAREIAPDRAGGHFGHCAASLAQQEHDDLFGIVSAAAGKERATAFDAMRESFSHEKIERAID